MATFDSGYRCVDCGFSCRPADRFCSNCGKKNPAQLPDDDAATLMPSAISVSMTNPVVLTPPPPVSSLRDNRLAQGSLFAGRYRIQRLVGQGGMGRVFAAVDESIDEMVALKVLADAYSADDEILGQFKKELKLARKVRQRNVVQSFDLGFTDGTCYISMEYIDAENLSKQLKKRGPFPERETLRIAQQVLKGLRAAHDLGIVHRDIKSGNILLNKDQVAFITDFGLATGAALVPTLCAGTPDYMAPEQFRGEAVLPATDLYATGILLYVMLTGRLPFRGTTFDALCTGHLFEKPDPIPEAIATRDTWEVVADLLKKEPAERPQRASMVIDRIAAILAKENLTVRTQQPIALLVESDQAVLWSGVEALEREGYHVLTADAARIGVKLAFENEVAVIVLDAAIRGGLDMAVEVDPGIAGLDTNLPGLEGLGFCRILQMDEKLKNVPVLVTAEHEQPGLREAFGLMGAAAVVTKPFGPEELANAVRSALTRDLGEDE